jgi:uncharacterized protein (PEP-CTERM system associated)
VTRGPTAARNGRSLVLALGLCLPAVALGARWNVETGVAAQTTWTDNAAFQRTGSQQEDTLLEIAPRINFVGEGARLRVFGSAVLSTLTYARGSQDSEFRPEVDIQARLEGIERLFFVEAGVRSTQVLESPFRPRPDGPSAFNTNTATQARLTPYLQSNISPSLRWQIRSDNTWSRQSDAQAAAQESDIYFGRHLIEVERLPVPLGVALQLQRDDTRYEDTLLPSFTTDIARVIGSYAFTPEFTVSVRAGYEWNNYVQRNDEGPIYGAGLSWRPSPRTVLTGFFEDRFFGSGWQMEFTHRMPRLAWNLSSTRDVGSFAQSLFDLGPTNNISALLDAILTSRIPDPIARGRAVQDIIGRQGLPSSTANATTVFGQRITLNTAQRASVALIGARNTLALGVFKLRTEELLDTTAFAFVGSPDANNTQEGVTASLSHTLTTLTSINFTSTLTNVRSLQSVGNDRSKQKSHRFQLSRQLGPRTSGFFGARYQHFDSSVDGDARERAAFVGFSHTFR